MEEIEGERERRGEKSCSVCINPSAAPSIPRTAERLAEVLCSAFARSTERESNSHDRPAPSVAAHTHAHTHACTHNRGSTASRRGEQRKARTDWEYSRRTYPGEGRDCSLVLICFRVPQGLLVTRECDRITCSTFSGKVIYSFYS